MAGTSSGGNGHATHRQSAWLVTRKQKNRTCRCLNKDFQKSSKNCQQSFTSGSLNDTKLRSLVSLRVFNKKVIKNLEPPLKNLQDPWGSCKMCIRILALRIKNWWVSQTILSRRDPACLHIAYQLGDRPWDHCFILQHSKSTWQRNRCYSYIKSLKCLRKHTWRAPCKNVGSDVLGHFFFAPKCPKYLHVDSY